MPRIHAGEFGNDVQGPQWQNQQAEGREQMCLPESGAGVELRVLTSALTIKHTGNAGGSDKRSLEVITPAFTRRKTVRT